MKRCKFCGRDNTRLIEVRTAIMRRPDGWKCKSPTACIRRMQRVGQWEGKRVLRRFDLDGTRWTIRRFDDIGLRGLASGPWESGYVLICEYRQHRMTSWHSGINKAKAHADEMIRSCEAKSLRQFATGR